MQEMRRKRRDIARVRSMKYRISFDTPPNSPSCPDCDGKGLTVKHFFAVPCLLCRANVVGSSHVAEKDFANENFMNSWVIGEKDPFYWIWLKGMVSAGHINPDTKPPQPSLAKAAKKSKSVNKEVE